MHYFEVEPEKNTFKSIVADITHRCNMRCTNCYVPNRTIPDMDIDALYPFLRRLPQRAYIRLVGAEPTLHPRLPEVIRTVLKLGHRVSVTTNGLLLSDPAFARELHGAGLRLVLISMNGADEDAVYEQLDRGKYSQRKMQALRNCMELGMFVSTGTIVAKGINEHTPRRQLRLVTDFAAELGLRYDRKRDIPPVLRIKSVGKIGNYLPERSYSLEELVEVVSRQLDVPPDFIRANPAVSGANPTILAADAEEKGYYMRHAQPSSYLFPVNTKQGKILVRLIDWSIDETGTPDPGNLNRGRITPDWKIAPCFEHIKKNEFGY